MGNCFGRIGTSLTEACAETACQKLGGLGVYEVGGYIWHRLLVFNTFFMTTFNFGGLRCLQIYLGYLYIAVGVKACLLKKTNVLQNP